MIWDASDAPAAVAQGKVLGMLARILKMLLELMDRMLGVLGRPVEKLEVVK